MSLAQKFLGRIGCSRERLGFFDSQPTSPSRDMHRQTMGKRGKRRRKKSSGEESSTKKHKSDSECRVSAHGTIESIQIPSPYEESIVRQSDFALHRPWLVLESRKKTAWNPTPIQLQSWSILMESEANLVGIAPTGSGKTYAYGLPLLSQIKPKLTNDDTNNNDSSSNENLIRGLVLVPTRELAIQVKKDIKRAKPSHCRIVAFYGGADKTEQLHQLNAETDATTTQVIIITATPGRLLDILQNQNQSNDGDNSKSICLKHLEWLVLDEADRLALQVDMAHQVDQILGYVPQGRNLRTCLFSATLPQATQKWEGWITSNRIMIKMNTVAVGEKEQRNAGVVAADDCKPPASATGTPQNEMGKMDDTLLNKEGHKKQRGPLDLARIPEQVTQTLHVCSFHKKPKKLMTTLQKIRLSSKQRNKSLCLIFFGRIKTLQYISKLLHKKNDLPCRELHSHLSQKEREKVLFNFRSGKIQVLLATDLAARGIHIPNVDYVINYDFPTTLEQYVHRCGRAGRSGQAATVYSFFHRELKPMAADVLELLEATNSWIDPNLRELLERPDQRREQWKFQKQQEPYKREKLLETESEAGEETVKDVNVVVDDEVEDWDNEFGFSQPRRIVLKRALHVSDDSSSEEEEEEEARE